jgi:hypothetical protein
MNRLIHKTALILLALLIFGQSMASAQQQDTIKIIEIDKTNFPDITVTVSYIPGQAAKGEPPFSASVENSPIEIRNVSPLVKPIAAVLVTDLSARMSDKGTNYTTRFENMQPFARDFISQLQGIQAPGTLGSLVVFNDSAKVAQSLTSDLQAINNTLNRADPNLIFEAQPLDSVEPSSSYPLGDALEDAIAELEKAPEELPRVLVVFASGDLNQQIDSQAFISSFNQARSDKRPISLVIFGFGSDQKGQFERFAAQPNALKSLSDQVGGDFVSIQGEVINASTKQEINAIFAKLIGRSNHYKLQFTTNNIPAGESELTISVNGSSDSISESFHDVPPRFQVVSDTRSFQDQVSLTIQTQFEQQPITEVEYFLDNISLGPPVSNAPEFELVIDAFDKEFQQRFPPGEHRLSAAARDANGNESRSESELSIVVMEPTTPAWRRALQEYWWLAVAILVVVILIGILGIVALMMAQKGRNKPPAVQGPQQAYANPNPMNYPIDNFNGYEEHTSHYVPQEEEPTTRLAADEEATELHSGDSTLLYEQDDKTQIYDPAAVYQPSRRWLLHIHNEPHPLMTVELSHKQRHYDIGRVMQHGRQAHIAIDNRLVSQTHAKLELMLDDLYLIAENSSNGTFFGNDQTPLAKEQRIQLTPGDVFWVSPKVKIVTESIMERA